MAGYVKLGHDAISISGAQAGIKTDSSYRQARILGIEAHRILGQLDGGKIVIVPGFQGITNELDITTLGRGGSDTSGIPLPALLGSRPPA